MLLPNISLFETDAVMRAVSLSLGAALDAFAGPTHVSTPQGPPQGGCIRGPHVSFRLDQKTANFKVSFDSGDLQWSGLTEEKQMNELAQRKVRFS